jgi:hypothetical protein
MKVISYLSAFSKIAFFSMLTGTVHALSHQIGSIRKKFDFQWSDLKKMVISLTLVEDSDVPTFCDMSQLHPVRN